MSQTDILQIIGTAGMLLFALILWRISVLNGRLYARYGREAMAVSSLYIMFIVLMRALDTANILTPPDARTYNGLAIFVALAILSQVAGIIQIGNHRRSDQDRGE